MKKVSLSGSLRENVGKKDAATLRRAGLVPCVVYGGSEQVFFSVKTVDLEKLIYTPDVFEVELNLGDKKVNAFIKELQFHPVTDKAIHVDFIEAVENKPVQIKLPVKISGNAPGIQMGGNLTINYRKVKVTGVPSAFPDSVEVSIEGMNIGDDVRISSLNIDGVTVNEAQNAVIVAVKQSRASMKAAQEAAKEEAAEA